MVTYLLVIIKFCIRNPKNSHRSKTLDAREGAFVTRKHQSFQTFKIVEVDHVGNVFPIKSNIFQFGKTLNRRKQIAIASGSPNLLKMTEAGNRL